MRFAKRCECEQPLTISSEDYCTTCTGLTGPGRELPPPPEDEVSAEEMAVQMRAAGASFAQIKEQTGCDDYTVIRLTDPARYEGIREGKNARNRAKTRADAAKALADPRCQRVLELYPRSQGVRTAPPATEHVGEIAGILRELREEGWPWRKVQSGTAIARKEAAAWFGVEA